MRISDWSSDVCSSDLEIGGVKLAITSPEDAAAEAGQMAERIARAAPDARLDGFLLSEMAPPGVELILGTRRDPLFGPLVMVGLGGVTAELFEDVAIRLRSEEHTSELQSLMRISYAVFCLKKKNTKHIGTKQKDKHKHK